jgi:hypothetical protein
MTEGDVVLTPLPQADGLVKNRPAVVLRAMPPQGDLLVCGVSTQLHHETPGFDEVILVAGPLKPTTRDSPECQISRPDPARCLSL